MTEVQCMVCGVRGSRCQQKRKFRSSFCTCLGRSFAVSMVVPCFVRRQFNNLVGNVCDVVSPDGKEYRFSVKKRDKTRISGVGYREFLSDYDMNEGDKIMIMLDEYSEFLRIFPLCPMGMEKHRAQEAEMLEEDASVVVYTSGLHLSATQSWRMNQFVGERGLGMGPVLVHKLTTTDINLNGLRIPKEIARALHISKSGWFVLNMGELNNTKDAKHVTSGDGRLRFKSGWWEFASECNLKTGNVVLILFKMGNKGYVNISFDVL